MILILDKRAVGIDVPYASGPELPSEYFQVVNELCSPRGIPRSATRANDQDRLSEIIECDLVVTRWQQSISIKVGNHHVLRTLY
jgi:hypothetical protein